MRKYVHGPARLRCWERSAVRVHHLRGELLALDVAGNDPLDERVSAQDQVAADWATHQTGEDLRAQIGLGPSPGVTDHERREAVWVACGQRKADRAAPVLHHHRHVPELQLQDQLLDDPRVLGGGEAVARDGTR